MTQQSNHKLYYNSCLTKTKSVLSIILPTFNECQNLPMLINQIKENLDGLIDYNIMIIDDDSPDGTGRIADELGDKLNNVSVLHRFHKSGITSAIMDGLKLCDSPIVAVMDADFQHSPIVLKKMINSVSCGNDLVIASRYIKNGSVEGWTPLRVMVSKGAAILTHLLLPRTKLIKDPLSGYFMFKRRIVSEVNLSGKCWKILLEILLKSSAKSVVEVPYGFRLRKNGKSKLKINVYLDFLSLLFNLKCNSKNFVPT